MIEHNLSADPHFYDPPKKKLGSSFFWKPKPFRRATTTDTIKAVGNMYIGAIKAATMPDLLRCAKCSFTNHDIGNMVRHMESMHSDIPPPIEIIPFDTVIIPKRRRNVGKLKSIELALNITVLPLSSESYVGVVQLAGFTIRGGRRASAYDAVQSLFQELGSNSGDASVAIDFALSGNSMQKISNQLATGKSDDDN